MTGRVKALAREDSEKGLPSKPAVWRTYLLEKTDKSVEVKEAGAERTCVERSESDIVGACSP